MKEFTEVYNQNTIKSVTAAARKAVIIFSLSAVAFVAICVAFCVLTAFDFVNTYLGCIVNVLLTVAFLWYGYLFFSIYYVPARKRRAIVKYLENAQPSLISGKFISETDDGWCLLLDFGNVKVSLDKSCAYKFIEGKDYDLRTVNGFIVSFREAEHE